jgi:hypothetical protein
MRTSKGRVLKLDEEKPMKTIDLTPCQKEVLANVVRRLRKQADRLDRVIRSGDLKKLSEACGMLHVTATQILWVLNGTGVEADEACSAAEGD